MTLPGFRMWKCARWSETGDHFFGAIMGRSQAQAPAPQGAVWIDSDNLFRGLLCHCGAPVLAFEGATEDDPGAPTPAFNQPPTEVESKP